MVETIRQPLQTYCGHPQALSLSYFLDSNHHELVDFDILCIRNCILLIVESTCTQDTYLATATTHRLEWEILNDIVVQTNLNTSSLKTCVLLSPKQIHFRFIHDHEGDLNISLL